MTVIIILALIVTNAATLVLVLARREDGAKGVTAQVAAHHEAAVVAPVTAPAPAPAPRPVAPQVPRLSAETMERLEKATRAAFEQAVAHAGQQFDNDLGATSEKLNHLIVQLTTDVVEKELEQYRASLVTAREQAVDSLQKMQDEVSKQEASIKADLTAVIDQRRTFMLDQLDKRIGQVVAGYLVESLGRGVDLGAQQAYLLDSLERNKDALKRDIRGEL